MQKLLPFTLINNFDAEQKVGKDVLLLCAGLLSGVE